MNLIRWFQSLFTPASPRNGYVSDDVKAFVEAFEKDKKGHPRMSEMPTMPPVLDSQMEDPLPRFRRSRNPIRVSDETRAALDKLERRLREQDSE